MKRFLSLAPILLVFWALGPGDAYAQSCCWNSSRAAAYPVGPPIPVTPTPPSGTAMNSYYGGYGMMPPSPGTFFPAGLPQTSAAFLPTASYDTRWVQTPVTYYRPVTQFDPNYGTTVTSLQPCTSYQYQAARVPLVSPRGINDYNYTANRWPAASAPGSYPAPTSAPMLYPGLQQVPAAGMPATSNMMNYASNGTNSGPSTTLPLATMSSAGGSVVSANYWAVPGTGTPIYTVPATAPTASLPTCPNGVCIAGNTPSIPGATSVTPMGPPTLVSPSALPATSSAPNGTFAPGPSFAPGLANPILPGEVKPILPPTSSPDVEAMQQPSLGNTSATFPLKRIPVGELDRTALEPSQPVSQQANRTPVTVPSTSNSSTSNPPAVSPPASNPFPSLLPLKAPSDFDAKPRWNPRLLPPSNDNAGETVASTPTVFLGTV